MTKRKRFTREFKEEAVKLLLNSDKSIQEIADSLGIHPNNLRWKCLFLENPKKAFPGNGNRRDNDDEVYRLKKELADMKMENEILKKSIAIFSRKVDKYRFMRDHQKEYPIEKMANVLNVSRSGYYKFFMRGETKQYRENILLFEKIRDIFQMSRRTYGSPRITDELHDMGYRCSKNRVWRIMKELCLVSCRHKKFKVRTTDSNHDLPVSPNLLGRKFAVSKPDKVWVSDITYISTREVWLFLCIILDLFSRKIIGWSMKEHMRTSLIIDALGRRNT